MSKLLNEIQVAEMLNCSVGFLRRCRLLRSGGPPFVKVGRLVRYDPDDLRAYIHEQREEPAV
jgi:excisionase family DNA binding protein